MAIALGILYSLVVVLHPLIVHLIPAVLLCISGLFTNLVQAICFVCIWPISENAYTRLNGVVEELDWRVLINIVNWAGVSILECIEQETSHLKREECELVISNVRNDADPLLEQVLAQSALKDFPRPFWLSVVLERTGFTQGDLRAAQRLPVPSKVLSSDTKDLAYAVRRAYSAVPAIYVITVAIPKRSSTHI